MLQTLPKREEFVAYENVIYEKRDKIARIILNRPEKLNAISDALRSDLEAACAEVESDRDVSVLIIKGAGRAFCAGYDIGPAGDALNAELTHTVSTDRERLLRSGERWLSLWSMPKPTIAQVHGYCLAGGNEIAGICDLVIAAEDAIFGQPNGRRLGIAPTLGLWPLLIGMRRTKELLFTGDSITGKAAAQIGMINKAVPADELEEETESLAARIALTPLDYLAVEKAATNRYFELMGIRTAVAAGAEYDTLYHATPTAKEFFNLVQEQGLKAALDWRDSPFGDYRGVAKRGDT
jgi:enoyl-CoA hydratase